MKKLNTEEKIAIVGAVIKSELQDGNVDVEDLAGIAFMSKVTKEHAIKIGELPALCKTFGINGGYIQTLEQKRAGYIAHCKDGELSELVTFGDVQSFVETNSEEFDLPEKWCFDTLQSIFENEGIYFPERSKLTKWQQEMVKAFRVNPKLTPLELDDLIKDAGIQNYSHYRKLFHDVCYALCNSEVTVD